MPRARLARPFPLLLPLTALWWSRVQRAATSRGLAAPSGEECSRWFKIADYADRRWFAASRDLGDGG